MNNWVALANGIRMDDWDKWLIASTNGILSGWLGWMNG
jgi:hypothetical protein